MGQARLSSVGVWLVGVLGGLVVLAMVSQASGQQAAPASVAKLTVAVDGWDVAHYLQNPVVLWAHSYSSPPVARAVQLYKTATSLMADDEFPEEGAYPFADTVYNLVKAGFLNTVSVGFQPQEWVYDEERGGINFLNR